MSSKYFVEACEKLMLGCIYIADAFMSDYAILGSVLSASVYPMSACQPKLF